MAKVVPFGEPENELEREAIDLLRYRLPDDYVLFTNLEIRQGLEIFEVDLILLTPHGLHVIDVKGTRGRIEIIDPKWHPENRQPFPSPVRKLRHHAKTLKSLICDANRVMSDLNRIYVQATVLVMHDVLIIDQSNTREGDFVTYLDERGLTYLQNEDVIPDRALKNIRPFYPTIERAIRGKGSRKNKPRIYRDWQIEDKLGGNDRYTEYRAREITMGVSGWTVRLRIYPIDPFLELGDRMAQQKLIAHALQAVRQLPPHANILGIQACFTSDENDCVIQVTEDIPGQALQQHIKKQDINLEQKLAIFRGILHGLDHAHKHGVIHRNITPDTILIAADGQVKLTGFDYARISANNSTIAHDIAEDLEEYAIYQAVECQSDPSKASITSDLFSAGLVFYELLTGRPAFESIDQMHTQRAIFPVKASDRTPDLPSDIDHWLQKLCAYNSSDRFANAYAALDALVPLATLPTLDITNLPTEHILDDRYRVIRRLGRPGSFAVAYQVFDTLDETVQVIKLVTRDRRSVYERLQQEYRTLRRVPKHPYIVDTVWAGKLMDGTPFILFEYVEGQDVEHLIESKSLSLEQAVEVAHQTALGLAHLHQHQVRHQDIKPSNLLLTNEGIRIIDFNVAVIDSDETTISAGTRRYMPPDFKPSLNPSTSEKVDRDLYGLGIVFYECVTGHYPFQEPHPPIGKVALNPTEFEGCEDLNEELVVLLLKAIAPVRSDRFTSAEELVEVINQLPSLRKGVEQLTPVEPELIQEDLPAITEPATLEEELPAIAEPAISGDLQELVELPLIVPASSEAIESKEDSLPPLEITSSPSTAKVNLFELLAVESIQPDLTHPIVLDPTSIYPIPSGYIAITNEVEWMRLFGLSASPYWVKGKRLCDWSIEWLRLKGREQEIKIKQDPRPRLETLFHPIVLPADWDNAQLLALSNKLDEYPTDEPIAHFLADVTGSDLQIWLGEPAPQHLAAWLAIQVPEQYQIFEQVWRQKLPAHDLTNYYQEDKGLLLRRWLGIAQPTLTKLDPYPLPIPDWISGEFDQFWEQEIYRSDGAILDELILAHQPGKERIAVQAYHALNNRPAFITKARETKLSAYLTHQQRVELSDRFSPEQPDLLAVDATPKQALEWAERYLHFRRWEIVVKQASSGERVSDRLADSFVEWLLNHYPTLKEEYSGDSVLNYSVPSLIRKYCQDSPVLWVVVDGLGWLDHRELLSYLTQRQLSLEVDLQPRLSILPTKTEYAKWSLYSQLLPRDSSWVSDAGKAFPKLGIGERYTDKQKAELLRDLRTGKHTLYCWDTTTFDKLFHTARDWKHLYKVERPTALKAIAEEIQSLIHEFPNPDQLRVVIATDHGQMLGESAQLTHCPPELEGEGRMAIGKTDDARFVVLERDRYGLPHDLSIVRGSGSFGSYSYTTNKAIIGSHGGLFPEEVVVGVSVLRKSVKRNPVLIRCKGEGEARKPGTLEIEIDNPNTVELVDLCLRIKELPTLETGLSLLQSIPANQKVSLSLPIAGYPERSPNREGDRLPLSGELTFRFANAELGSASLDVASAIKVHQIFSSGLDIDEFL
jgi:serine/threonine protein kinase